MSDLTPAVQTALAADTPLVAGLLKIELPDATVRLLDGAGVLEWNGETFVGRDEVFGSLAGVDEIDDGADGAAPALSFTLLPASDASAAILAGPTMQGSPVTLWIAAVDRETGAVIPDPYPLFIGVLDQPRLRLRKGVRELDYDCVSAMEMLFANVEGVRLADAWHQNVWPGELGLANVSAIIKTVYWGVHAPRGSVVSGGGGFATAAANALGFDYGRAA